MTDIRSRLSIVFAALGFLCIIIATVALHGLADANERAERTYRQITLPAQHLADEYRLLLLIGLQVYEANQINDVQASKPQFDTIALLLPALRKEIDLFKASKKPEIAEKLAEEFQRNFDAALRGLLESMQSSQKGDVVASMEAMAKKSRPYGIAAGTNVRQLTDILNKEAVTAHAQAIVAYQHMRSWVLGALIVGGVLCAVAVWWQMKAIGISLSSIQETLHEASRSLDLTQKVRVLRRDEIGRTATAFNELIERVMVSVSRVRSAAESVHTAVLEIASGNADLSARTEAQAASLERCAASMTQLTEAVKDNADSSQQAHTLATQATDLADAGSAAVLGMVATIEEINSSSSKISEITGVIEGIAFQTNILSLNAAVEAARAGEQGRGFAVVASEVRGLAQRSATAAKEIKELIGSSVEITQGGARQANEVRGTIAQVKHAIKQVSEVVHEIAFASEAQSRDIGQMNSAVVQLGEMTQRNAALVEQVAAAARSLEEQAKNVTATVSVFTLAEASTVRS